MLLKHLHFHGLTDLFLDYFLMWSVMDLNIVKSVTLCQLTQLNICFLIVLQLKRFVN